MDTGNILFLSRKDILGIDGDDMGRAVDAVKGIFKAWDNGGVIQPAKTTLKYLDAHEKYAGLVNVLPAAIRNSAGETYGLKALGAMPSNLKKGIPRATGIILLFDGVSKTPIACMDAQVISAMRTGAITAIAAEKLCKPNTSSVGLVGSGVNMRTQLMGLQYALPSISHVKVYSLGGGKHDFVSRMSKRFPRITIVATDTAEEAVTNVDVVVTCVANADSPVVSADAVNQPGVTVFNIGCLENEPRLLQEMDLIVSDYWDHSKHRGVQTHAVAFQEGLIKDEDVMDLGDIVSSRISGRSNNEERIFFCPTGLGVEDVTLARDIFSRACKRGVGQSLELWDEAQWI